MSKKIYKYQLAIIDVQTVSMPHDARLLHVGTQANAICIWAMVDPSKSQESRTFLVIGTGHAMPEENTHNLRHLGTVTQAGGALVWHVFEKIQ